MCDQKQTLHSRDKLLDPHLNTGPSSEEPRQKIETIWNMGGITPIAITIPSMYI